MLWWIVQHYWLYISDSYFQNNVKTCPIQLIWIKLYLIIKQLKSRRVLLLFILRKLSQFSVIIRLPLPDRHDKDVGFLLISSQNIHNSLFVCWGAGAQAIFILCVGGRADACQFCNLEGGQTWFLAQVVKHRVHRTSSGICFQQRFWSYLYCRLFCLGFIQSNGASAVKVASIYMLHFVINSFLLFYRVQSRVYIDVIIIVGICQCVRLDGKCYIYFFNNILLC